MGRRGVFYGGRKGGLWCERGVGRAEKDFLEELLLKK